MVKWQDLHKSALMTGQWYLLILLWLISSISCSKKNYSSKPEYNFVAHNGIPDYSSLNCWAAHPGKWDPSDSVPEPMKINHKKDSLADVFFLHPTTLTNLKDIRWNAPIDDAVINAATDYGTILYQASVFNERCRVFAPRYRQAHIRAFYRPGAEADTAFELAYHDIKTAFEYYLRELNHGQPIIIAAHSQGTKHAGRLLKEFFEGKPLQNKLVCAYIIGMPVPDNYFASLKPCDNATGVGCFVAWRTFRAGSELPPFVGKDTVKSIVTNPLSWTRDSLKASSSLNKGGILKNFNKLVPAVVDAQVHGNILWASKPKFFGSFLLKTNNYHIGDINLYYANIKENVKDRISAYLKPEIN